MHMYTPSEFGKDPCFREDPATMGSTGGTQSPSNSDQQAVYTQEDVAAILPQEA